QAHKVRRISLPGQLLHPLDVVHTAHAANAGDDAVEVVDIAGLEDDVDGGPGVAGLGLDVADVGILSADDGRDLGNHAGAVVAADHELHRIARRRAGDARLLGRPLHGQLAL